MTQSAAGGSSTKRQELSLNFDNPLDAVFLRRLAWEVHVAKMERGVEDTVSGQLAAARRELGLNPFAEGQGGGRDYIQGLRRRRTKPLITAAGTKPRPLDASWENAWRLHNVPHHDSVRRLVHDEPVNEKVLPSGGVGSQGAAAVAEVGLRWREPGVPRVRAYVGRGPASANRFGQRRGLYALRDAESLYVGQTREHGTRLRTHNSSKQVGWWVFVSPENAHGLSSVDALDVAESILISYWAEVAVSSNHNRHRDTQPQSEHHLVEGISLARAAAAAILWCVLNAEDLEVPEIEIPFKKGGPTGWRKAYLAPPSDF